MNKEKIKNKKIENSVLIVFAILVLAFIGANYLGPAITGFITVKQEFNYSDGLNLAINSSFEYIWQPDHFGELSSIRLNGKVEDRGHAKVYVENDNVRYLIFDSERLEQGLGGITGLAVLNEADEMLINSSIANESSETSINSSIINETLPINQTINETAEVNEPIENLSINKKITADLKYKDNSDYDADNDGIETLTGVVDLTVEGSFFSWDVDENKLCARWEIYSLDKEEAATVCYGSEQCCNFIELAPSGDNWKDIFYSYYGLYGADFNNIVSVQVIYADYNLSIDEPFAEIYYSEWDNLTVKFTPYEKIPFKDVCIETCLLSGFDKAGYKLIFEINNTVLSIDSIKYSIAEEIANKPPRLIKNISNVEIAKNKNYSVDLSKYFSDEDELSYEHYKADNITVLIEENIAVIIPDKNFIGIRHMFFIANDSKLTAVSNVFSINVTEESIEEDAVQLNAEIGKPVKWVKKAKGKIILIPEHASEISVNKVVNEQKFEIEKNKIKIKEKQKEKELAIEDDADYFEVVYETEAPSVNEIEVSYFIKQIVISSNTSYTDVLAYTSVIDSPRDAIRLYWIKDGIRELFTDVSYNDTNSNGLVDRLEWTVPHLSEQVFEVEITILNIKSYPQVGDKWIVNFTTVGAGNLTISAYGGTVYSEVYDNSFTEDDLEFLEVKCGDVVVESLVILEDGTVVPYDLYLKIKRVKEIDEVLG